jgi:hypothetical protein
MIATFCHKSSKTAPCATFVAAAKNHPGGGDFQNKI